MVEHMHVQVNVSKREQQKHHPRGLVTLGSRSSSTLACWIWVLTNILGILRLTSWGSHPYSPRRIWLLSLSLLLQGACTHQTDTERKSKRGNVKNHPPGIGHTAIPSPPGVWVHTYTLQCFFQPPGPRLGLRS